MEHKIFIAISNGAWPVFQTRMIVYYLPPVSMQLRDFFEPLLEQRCSGEEHLIGTQSPRSRAGRFHLDPATRGIGVNAPGLHQRVTVTANIVSYFRSLSANSCRLDGRCRCLINHIPPAFLVPSGFHSLCQIETLKLQNSYCLAKYLSPSVDQNRRFFVET